MSGPSASHDHKKSTEAAKSRSVKMTTCLVVGQRDQKQSCGKPWNIQTHKLSYQIQSPEWQWPLASRIFPEIQWDIKVRHLFSCLIVSEQSIDTSLNRKGHDINSGKWCYVSAEKNTIESQKEKNHQLIENLAQDLSHRSSRRWF